MSHFFGVIGQYFSDVGAVVEPVGDGVVGITAHMTEKDCDSHVKDSLNSLDLYPSKFARGHANNLFE
ncbi:hypothetical protein [Xanthomonas sp. LF06-19]|uniref:hypothetical protein n=1 Tax=Xanthomonas sp. LF06-19 TaxID=3097551 RepID=UPI002A83425F|nr:hypothetical protein [Xanthomonas sp. LF06-19]MDY4285469.1 hypothetical protein [Xanthomonas sp. LF06-19]